MPDLEPAVLILDRDGRCQAIAGVQLVGIGRDDGRTDDARTKLHCGILRRHMDLLVELASAEEDRLFDLRFVSHPDPVNIERGTVDVYVLCKLSGDNAKRTAFRARLLVDDMLAALGALTDLYEFSALDSVAAIEAALKPFPLNHFVELVRREGFITLAAVRHEHRQSPIGFGRRQPVEPPQPDPSVSNPRPLFHVYPFLPACSSRERFCDILLHARSPMVASILLRPVVMPPAELEALRGLAEVAELGGDATAGGSPATQTADGEKQLAPGELSTFSLQARVLRDTVVRQLHCLQDSAFWIGMRLASGSPDEPVRSMAAESFGSEFTQPGSYQGAIERMFVGGFEWARASGASIAEARRSIEDMEPVEWIESMAPTGLEHLRSHVSLEEAAAVFQLPLPPESGFPGIRTRHARTSPPPSELSRDGILLGNATHRGRQEPVRVSQDDRRRHFYAVGQTGTGKSTLFHRLILDDIRAGAGVGVIDPHGDLIDKLLPAIPRGRWNDVILFDPDDRDFPFGLNILEWISEEERYFLVDETLAVLIKMFPPEMTGPFFEHSVRNALLLLMADRDSPGTLVELPRIFQDKSWHKKYLPKVQDALCINFWTREYANTSDFHKSETLGYIVSKFDRFIANPAVRNIIGQSRSSFRLRTVMDEGKILLCKLAKGSIGETSSRLLGMLLVSKIFSAALQRGNTPEHERRDFFLYVDEFQNLATPTFASILSEARKYRLNLFVTNQYLWQVGRDILAAILGNVGTLIAFRVGPTDAAELAPYFAPSFSERDIANLDRYHAYVNLLIHGRRTLPFCMQTIPDNSVAEPDAALRIREASRRFACPREQVEAAIAERLEFAPAGKPAGGE
jgi:Type IV secretory system Conjugative DNA transfer